jgi:hypothetical protein
VPGPNGKYTVTIFPGDGIGPEISKAVQEIFEASVLFVRCASRVDGEGDDSGACWNARTPLLARLSVCFERHPGCFMSLSDPAGTHTRRDGGSMEALA